MFSLYGQEKVIAQSQTVSVGIRLQKSINFYLENGFSVYYNSDKILSDKILFGIHYVSSRLNSAINSNAIKQYKFFFNAFYIMRSKKKLNILTGIDLGYFHADYEEPVFDDLQNQSLLLALEAGLRYNIIKRLSINSTLGYNFITGDGTDGTALIYKGVRSADGGPIEIEMIDSDLHVFTRLSLRAGIVQKDVINQQNTFEDMLNRILN